ncbi:MAG: ATP-binding protein [Verrucomicrobiales bacterium]
MPATATDLLESTLRQLIAQWEGECVEFKEATDNFPTSDIGKYFSALANEANLARLDCAWLVFGVRNRDRSIVGTTYRENRERLDSLKQQIGQDTDPPTSFRNIHEITVNGHRVLMFEIPAAPRGIPVGWQTHHYARDGESLTGLSFVKQDQIRAQGSQQDFSAEICPGLTLDELAPEAIERFRQLWQRRSPASRASTHPDRELLEAAELADATGLTYAALLLFATRETMGRYLPQAEIVFEYRSGESAGPAQDREEYRAGFLTYHDALWMKINLRNDRQSYQDDFFRFDIPTFDEPAIREALLNAFAHRDYRLTGSVFVRQYARRLEVVSPGGFPEGITAENIADQQNPRNRRLAEALARCGLIERSGQGINVMIERAIRQTKPLPDFSASANHEVRLTLVGTVQNPAFIRYTERLGEETLNTFSTDDFLALDALSREEDLAERFRLRVPRLIELGAVESQGRGRGTRLFLSRSLYEEIGKPGAYTRRRGLDHETNKELLVRHLTDRSDQGAPMREFIQVLPAQSESAIRRMLHELRDEKRIELRGRHGGRSSRWFILQKPSRKPFTE